MNPTFRAGDILRIVSCEEDDHRRGDAIVFTPPDRTRMIVHRVIAVSSAGFRTRGDRNKAEDPWIVTRDRVVGKVVGLNRIGVRRPVKGGLYGRVYAGVIRTGRRCDAKASVALHPFYHWLAGKGWFRSLVPSRLKPRILRFASPAGLECQLLLGQHVIGRLLPSAERWHIRRPFRLLVDEAFLPRGEHSGE